MTYSKTITLTYTMFTENPIDVSMNKQCTGWLLTRPYV